MQEGDLMARPLQHRDVNDPIAEIVRRHLDALDVAAIYHGPLIRELQDHATDMVRRAGDEACKAYEDTGMDRL
jgi:hypothetical protein